MAAVVSVVAVIAIVGIGGIFTDPRHAAAGGKNPRIAGQEDAPVRAYIFSFGLEHVSHPKAGGPAHDGSATRTR